MDSLARQESARDGDVEMTPLDLFDNVGGQIVPRDVCARKHGGNPQSAIAFDAIRQHLTQSQWRVFCAISATLSFGRTLDELCVLLDVNPNAISGRITELRIKGKIEKRGTRKTRSGCSAAVWVAKTT